MSERMRSVRIRRFTDGVSDTLDDLVPAEHTLGITLDGAFVTELSCSHSALDALAVGHLLSAGRISHRDGVDVILEDSGEKTQALVTTAGKAGAQSKTRIHCPSSPVTVDPETIYENMERLTRDSSLFLATGAAHCTGFFRKTTAHIIHDDIARHNTVDRVVGEAHLTGVDLASGTMCTTGRVSSEIALRCLGAGVTILVSRGAPTHLAVRMADDGGMTLLGFARGRRFNCYTHPHRLQTEPGA